jgi:hypothetical protein
MQTTKVHSKKKYTDDLNFPKELVRLNIGCFLLLFCVRGVCVWVHSTGD